MYMVFSRTLLDLVMMGTPEKVGGIPSVETCTIQQGVMITIQVIGTGKFLFL